MVELVFCSRMGSVRRTGLAKVVLLTAVSEVYMLFIALVCLVLWFLGMMTTYTLGGILHILLVIAVVLFLVHIIQGSSIGNA
jgi:uncharacterized membrane protein YtjA (UPF0391 family)